MTVHRLFMLVTVAAMAALVGLPAPAEVQPDIAVYANSSGNYWQGAQTLSIGTIDVHELELYIDKLGTGAGDEIYGYDVVIQIDGDGAAYISSFVPDGTLASKMASFPETPDGDTRQLRVNLVDVNPLNAEPIHIGTLAVNTANASNTVDVIAPGGDGTEVQGALVLSNLDLMPIPAQTIAVPEPHWLLLLLSGIAGLFALDRLRSRGQ